LFSEVSLLFIRFFSSVSAFFRAELLGANFTVEGIKMRKRDYLIMHGPRESHSMLRHCHIWHGLCVTLWYWDYKLQYTPQKKLGNTLDFHQIL
jgi:hypothetical protein